MLDTLPTDAPAPAGALRGGDRRPEAAVLLVALAASAALHAAAIGFDILLPGTPTPPPAERTVEVEILGPEALAALTAPQQSDADRAALSPEAGPEAPAATGMVRPTAMLSARELADPRSAEARAMLPRLDDADRMIQLCGIEAMAQVHAWRERYRPDRIVAHAGGEVAIAGDRVDAARAAFRSGDAWYGLAYECRLAPDHATVTAFAFRVRGRVPRAEWAARNLPDPALDRD